jgi:lactate dehydrogenase-like 2-hydroxyacid dehydrogenase
MTRTILALNSIFPADFDALEPRFNVLKLWREADPEAAIRAQRQHIVGIVSSAGRSVSRSLIEALPHLEIISNFSVGTDNIDLAAAAERGIVVTNTPDVLTADTADTAIALLLAVARRVCEADMYVRLGKWPTGPMGLGTSLSGKRAGVVGLGRIGNAIARRLEAFDISVSYYGRRKHEDAPYTYYSDLKAMAAECDFLILAISGGPDTANLVDDTVLQALGPHGILVNVARGSVVNETDLLNALASKTIAGAGLDVYAAEPNVPEALFKLDNVVLLPHIGSATTETRLKMGRLVIDNLLAHFDGKALKTPVTVNKVAV